MSHPSKRLAGALFLCLGILSSLPVGSARGDVLAIGQAVDATLLSEDAKKANGKGQHLFAGQTDGGDTRRALLRFDVAGSLPAGSTIHSVSLTLTVNRSEIAGSRTQDLHAVTADWTEGPTDPPSEEGGGDSAQRLDVTWEFRSYDPNDEAGSPVWASKGGDFSSTASASAAVGANGTTATWSSAQMASDVQAWLDTPASNFGWLLKDATEAGMGTAKRFASEQNPTVSARPVLTVDFTPFVVTGACCHAGATGSCSITESTTCSGTYQGNGSSCSPNACPTGCCLPNAQAQCIETDAASCTAQGGTVQGAACAVSTCPIVLTPYLDPLPIPAVAQPVTGTAGGAADYHIRMRETSQQLHSQLAGPTTVWGYDDGTGTTFPGPTVEATVGSPVNVTWENDLRDSTTGLLRSSHYLDVDLCPHGAALNADARAVVHLHGAHVEAAFDGYPEATFPPGGQVVYSYPNWQVPGTLWYHDHALGITRLNVYMGLAGFWLIRDAYEQGLGLPAGEFEIPLAIQDRSFKADGSLDYPTDWQQTFFGDHILVNGKVSPFLNVKPGKYRFRLLNGCGSRTLRLALSTGAPITVIGTEGGLLPAPIAVSPLTIGSGERADVVIDFEPYAPGTEVLLVNDAPAPFPGPPGAGVVPDVMKFVVSNLPGSPPHTAPLPVSLRPIETLQEIDATVSREFHLRKEPGTCTTEEWTIQSIDAIGNVVGSKWDDITEQPELGETEVWRFVNRSGMMHPMHMHLVLFQILDRQACNETGSQCVPTGPVLAPLPEEQGWKDTIQVGPDEIVRVIARFEDYEGLFAYHCHILEHEDHEMMRQFQSVATVPHCGDGLDNDGDGFTDFAGGDPGCVDALDAGERGPTLPCDDGLDNDGDALADYPADPGCASPGWTTEVPEPSFGPALLISAAWLASMANGRAGSAAGSGSRRGRSRRRARPPGRDAVGPRTLRSL